MRRDSSPLCHKAIHYCWKAASDAKEAEPVKVQAHLRPRKRASERIY